MNYVRINSVSVSYTSSCQAGRVHLSVREWDSQTPLEGDGQMFDDMESARQYAIDHGYVVPYNG